jgi:hypothetical protein
MEGLDARAERRLDSLEGVSRAANRLRLIFQFRRMRVGQPDVLSDALGRLAVQPLLHAWHGERCLAKHEVLCDCVGL